MTRASLYFHIPFCSKKCPYCHFYVIPNSPSFHQILEEGLSLEWEKNLPLLEGLSIESIYFGGGTPSFFVPGGGVARLLEKIRGSRLALASDCEITLEANPEEASPELFSSLLSVGVNRLSLGIQSLDERSLQSIERIHTAQKGKQAILEAHRAGFQNISIDLMYDLPDQTESSWLSTLNQLSSLPIQHVSLYNLTIEPHTSFYKRKESLSFPPPISSLRMLNQAVQTLTSLQFKRYEISAFAKQSSFSKHNIGYWTGRPFLGFGPSACSYWEGKRFRNISHLQRYTRKLKEGISPIDFSEKLPYLDSLKERLAVELRLIEGADLNEDLPPETKQCIERLIEEDFLKRNEKKICLTEKGILFHDTIASVIV